MSVPTTLSEPDRVDEPQVAREYSEVLSRVAREHRPVIVRRDGADLAAVIPLEHLEVLREALAWQEVEKLGAQINWDRAVKTLQPPQSWFDGDEPNPFEPEEQARP
jgi:prevent-host-death family protein